MELTPPEYDEPHVVVLGAGASRAACPRGDKHGRLLPLMRSFIKDVQLAPVLAEQGFDCDWTSFEDLCVSLTNSSRHATTLDDVKRHVYDYFSRLRLPDKPTLYDH